VVFVDVECDVARQEEQLFRVAEDDVAKRFEHRPPRAEDAGLQLFDAEVETRIDHSRGCPNVVCERRFQERTAHEDLLSPTPDVEHGRCPGPLGQAAAHLRLLRSDRS
jgi:hypothetical protein